MLRAASRRRSARTCGLGPGGRAASPSDGAAATRRASGRQRGRDEVVERLVAEGGEHGPLVVARRADVPGGELDQNRTNHPAWSLPSPDSPSVTHRLQIRLSGRSLVPERFWGCFCPFGALPDVQGKDSPGRITGYFSVPPALNYGCMFVACHQHDHGSGAAIRSSARRCCRSGSGRRAKRPLPRLSSPETCPGRAAPRAPGGAGASPRSCGVCEGRAGCGRQGCRAARCLTR